MPGENDGKTFTALFLHILIKPSHVNIILCFPNYMMTRTLYKKYTEHFSVYLCKKNYYKWVRMNHCITTQNPYKNEKKCFFGH